MRPSPRQQPRIPSSEPDVILLDEPSPDSCPLAYAKFPLAGLCNVPWKATEIPSKGRSCRRCARGRLFVGNVSGAEDMRLAGRPYQLSHCTRQPVLAANPEWSVGPGLPPQRRLWLWVPPDTEPSLDPASSALACRVHGILQ
jgi:hypothetical protein